jgi:hypothetical protein
MAARPKANRDEIWGGAVSCEATGPPQIRAAAILSRRQFFFRSLRSFLVVLRMWILHYRMVSLSVKGFFVFGFSEDVGGCS